MNIAEEYRKHIKELLKNTDDEDIVFLRQIYTMFKVHLQKRQKIGNGFCETKNAL